MDCKKIKAKRDWFRAPGCHVDVVMAQLNFRLIRLHNPTTIQIRRGITRRKQSGMAQDVLKRLGL